VVGAVVFLTPWAALVALAVAVPLAAAGAAAMRNGRVRSVLGLDSPRGGGALDVACLAAVPLLLALAAAGPAIRSPVGRGILDKTEALFVFDVSRSMGAASAANAPTRLAQAKSAAEKLRDAVPDARAGVASLTTQLLPELFPTADESAFTDTVDRALGVLKPPPPAFQAIATTFDPLAALRDQGFFSSEATHRVAVLLTDGESTKYFPTSVGQQLAGTSTSSSGVFGGPLQQQPQQSQAPVKLLIVRVGSSRDRIRRPDGTVDPGYRPDLRAPQIVGELAQAANGSVFQPDRLGAAESALRSAVGSGPASTRITTTKTRRLAPYVALLALVPLGLLVWRRNVVSL